MDLIVTHQATTSSYANVSVLKNTGNAFAGQVTYPTDEKPYAVKLGDLDGDGKIDIAVANNGSSNISLYKNITTSTDLKFNEKLTIAAMINPASIHIADADGDGRPDLITPSTSLFGAAIGISKNVYPLTITANNQSICSNGAVGFDKQSYTVSGLVNNDIVSNVNLTSIGGATLSPVGSYPIIPSNAVGNGLQNYKIRYVNGVLTKEAAIPGIRMAPMDVARNENIQLNARSIAITNAQYSWTPFANLSNGTIANPIATMAQQEEYKIKIVSKSGCVTVDTLLVRVHSEKSVYLPNAFSPNGDGLNDIFKVKLVGCKLSYFSIYDRYGKLVFYTSDEYKGWDGFTNGVRMPAGTYGWGVGTSDVNGSNPATKYGSVLLIR